MGEDTLTGSQGKDNFVLNNSNEGTDTITDFSVEDDSLILSAAGFNGLVTGSIDSEFTVGTAATSNEHRLIYDTDSGDLFYDRDGTGNNSQLKLASLTTGLALTSNDFYVDL